MKRKIYTILVAIVCFTASEAFAQGFMVSGLVTDASTGEVLTGVNVAIPSLNRGAVTDINGRYTLLLASGEYHLVATYIGYQRDTQAL